jgi:predicted TIM-barrel fold metal-dependent hydrolase
MSNDKIPASADIRKRQGHPTIDADGHVLEYRKIVLDYMDSLFGVEMREDFLRWDERTESTRWAHAGPTKRLNQRLGRPQFWATAAGNTLDRATAVFPNLRRARMDELGIDYAILYPSAGLAYVNLPHDQFRPALCRAYNAMVADLYRDHEDRMTPVAIIPMYTPEEAIDELDHAVGQRGLKTVMLANFVVRTVPVAEATPPEIARAAHWYDMLALDSPYDYDPVWAKCRELKVAVTSHNTTFGLGMRRSTSNFMYNHCGHFAAGGEMFAKALFFGGVTARFPGLSFAFMEGGTAWGGVLFQGLVSRWEKRNASAIGNYDSANVDHDLMGRLFDEYAGELIASHIPDDHGADPPPRDFGLGPADRADPAMVDDFAACEIERAEDIVERFAKPFYFGCEADDPYAGAALRGEGMPFGIGVNALFSTDIGHWDVVDARHVVAEAYEQLEHGLMDETQYRDFMFANTVRLHGGMNRDFFKGTVVEDEAADVLNGESAA